MAVATAHICGSDLVTSLGILSRVYLVLFDMLDLIV